MNVLSDVMVNMLYRLKLYKGFLYFALLFNFVIGKSCDSKNLIVAQSQCSDNQMCDEESGQCVCKPGYQSHNETFCIEINPRHLHTAPPNTSSLVAGNNNGSIVAGILIPLFLILIVIYAVYVSRKYKLVNWFQRKLHQRNNNYDEFMIGQEQDPEDDDPPLH